MTLTITLEFRIIQNVDYKKSEISEVSAHLNYFRANFKDILGAPGFQGGGI